MTSWRISVLLNDQSAITRPSIGSVGATVVKSEKGPEAPIFFAPGQSARIRSIYGEPSAFHASVWDAIQYNNQFPLWISAPSSYTFHGGVIVRPAGTTPFSGGIPSDEFASFSALPQAQNMGEGDESAVDFVAVITNTVDLAEDSIDITVDGIAENITASDNGDGTWALAGDGGTGVYDSADGTVTYTFGAPPAANTTIDLHYSIDVSDAYFILFDKRGGADDLAAMIAVDGDNNFTISAYKRSGVNYSSLTGYPMTVSLTEGAKDGFGKVIFAEDVFESDDLIGAIVNDSASFSAFVDDSAQIDFTGGDRGVTASTDLVRGWQQFQARNTYPVDVFFDATADPAIPAEFDTLRNGFQKYSAYILPTPYENTTDVQATRTSYGLNSRGIYLYWNWGLVRDGITGRKFWSTLMGRVATKHAQMYNVYNGLAPSWTDENNHGGQLGSGILKMAYDPSETELKTLDEVQINPIILSPEYGPMITSQRTTVTTLSDYSWIGHSRTADFIIRNVIEQVLPYQITKLNDADHRNRAKSKADRIIEPLSNPPYNLLRGYEVLCDETNNTDDVLARREFVLEVRVKFTPFSEYVRFIFTNVDQSTEISEG